MEVLEVVFLPFLFNLWFEDFPYAEFLKFSFWDVKTGCKLKEIATGYEEIVTMCLRMTVEGSSNNVYKRPFLVKELNIYGNEKYKNDVFELLMSYEMYYDDI